MNIWRVKGGAPLEGSLTVQGAKNAVLPILAACILTGCETELTNCPRLRDVEASLNILRHLGCAVDRDGDVIHINSTRLRSCSIPHELMRAMRSSVIFLGAVAGRCGEAWLSMPGGCELGPRPIDLHLNALRALGAEVEELGGDIVCRATALHGAHITLAMPSVGATENAMIAACAAKGETRISNAAREPEIVDLQGFLRALGADIDGAGTSEIVIRGFTPRGKVGWRVMPDRIVSSTFLCACAATGGEVELRGVTPAHFAGVTGALAAMGCEIREQSRSLRLRSNALLRAAPLIQTRPYPGFPTDAQPLMMAASLRAQGTTVFVENIFPNRYRQAAEMRRFGADIRIQGRVAMITGVPTLHGASVRAEDLRGGAALVIAALAAEGESVILDPGHIERGYDALDEGLRALGATVEKHAESDEAR